MRNQVTTTKSNIDSCVTGCSDEAIEITLDRTPVLVVDSVTVTAGDDVFHIPSGVITQTGDGLKIDGMAENDKPRFQEAIRKRGY